MLDVAAETPLLTFAFDAWRCALDVKHVQEVVRAALPMHLPKAPEIVDGVLDVRGRLVPLLDVRGRFGLPPRPLDPSQHIVIAAVEGRMIGFAVDEVSDIVRVPGQRISAADTAVSGVEHVAGIARLPDGLVVIYDLRAFLSADEALGLDGALRAVGTS